MNNKIKIPYKEIEVGEKRFFCNVELFFGEFQITKYFVRVTEIKKQVAKYAWLFNEKIISSAKISDMNTWSTDKDLMKRYFIEKLEKNLLDFEKRLTWYTDKYPLLNKHKSQIQTIKFLIKNVDRIFSEDQTFNDDLRIQQGYFKTESIRENGKKSILWQKQTRDQVE